MDAVQGAALVGPGQYFDQPIDHPAAGCRPPTTQNIEPVESILMTGQRHMLAPSKRSRTGLKACYRFGEVLLHDCSPFVCGHYSTVNVHQLCAEVKPECVVILIMVIL